MERLVIHKPSPDAGRLPNLSDYDATRGYFSWDLARAWLDGLPAGGVNIAHEAVDRHLPQRADQPALRVIHQDESVSTFTYGRLAQDTARFANVLRSLGVSAGERVFSLLGRRYETFVVCLGTLKNRSVSSQLFTAYGPDPICQRLQIGDARVLVTTRALYRRKIAASRSRLPMLEHVLIVDDDGDVETLGFGRALDAALPAFDIPATDPEDMALLHFTSGTTGTPKGAVHVHDAVVAHYATGLYALDLHQGDVFWCTADPGWVTGTSYGIVAPLTHGVTVVVDEGEFDAERWWRTLAREHVSIWYTAPTALRMLMTGSGSPRAHHDLSALRFIASVGEPLNPEAVIWGQDVLGLPVHDNWWQTETGGIMIANFAGCDLKPGSMGRPLPGIDAALVAIDDDGEPVIADGEAQLVSSPEETGILALRPGWPSMFRGYLHERDRYRACFKGGWYLTGDLAQRDAGGWYWFVGRGDDVIKSAGHLIGPFEVESALLEHAAVAEAGVVGKPDPIAGAIVKAFVTLQEPYEPTDALRLELIGFARKKLGAAVAPREIEFVSQLPHTESGKILRRVLKEAP